jgi:hypothetical protein
MDHTEPIIAFVTMGIRRLYFLVESPRRSKFLGVTRHRRRFDNLLKQPLELSVPQRFGRWLFFFRDFVVLLRHHPASWQVSNAPWQSLSSDGVQDLLESSGIGVMPIVVAEDCSSGQRQRWNGSTLTYVPRIARFGKLQKFSKRIV